MNRTIATCNNIMIGLRKRRACFRSLSLSPVSISFFRFCTCLPIMRCGYFSFFFYVSYSFVFSDWPIFSLSPNLMNLSFWLRTNLVVYVRFGWSLVYFLSLIFDGVNHSPSYRIHSFSYYLCIVLFDLKRIGEFLSI